MAEFLTHILGYMWVWSSASRSQPHNQAGSVGFFSVMFLTFHSMEPTFQDQSHLNTIQTFRLCVCWIRFMLPSSCLTDKTCIVTSLRLVVPLLIYTIVSQTSVLGKTTFFVRTANHLYPYVLNIFLDTNLKSTHYFFFNVSFIASNSIHKIRGLLC